MKMCRHTKLYVICYFAVTVPMRCSGPKPPLFFYTFLISFSCLVGFITIQQHMDGFCKGTRSRRRQDFLGSH